MIRSMLKAVTQALQSQQVSVEKIRHITNRLENLTHQHAAETVWRTFCESCLEVGIDPQAVFAIAVMNYPDSLENPDMEGEL